MKKVLKKLTPFISIIFFCVALWFLDQKLQEYELAEIMVQLQQIPNLYILLSLILCFFSYLLLTGYDALGVNYIGESLETSKIVRAGYVGYAFSHNIGLALITGGSIRYRIYSAWGFSGMQVTQIVAFSAFTLWIGFCAVAGLALVLATPNLPADVVVPFVSLRVLGGILLAMVVGYVWASAKFNNELTFKSWSFTFPSLTLALKQVAIASVDWLLMASVLFVLLPDVGISFFGFLGVFMLAQIIGLFSQVPGGLGVFESVMLLYLSNFMPGSQVLGILVVYRIIYYILPLLGALMVLGYQEYLVNRHRVQQFKDKATHWVPRVVPQVMSFSIFIGGAILLFSGAVPSEMPRIQWLQHFVPLPVIEMSHFFASLVGAALLVLASALQRRIDGAYHITVGLLVFGIIFSLLKGADYEEASILAVMLAVLIPCRDEFHRKASIVNQKFSARWITLILMVLVGAVWLGIFSYRNVEYQKELWWKFTLMGDAPRYLRATVAAMGFAVLMGLIKLLKPRPQRRSTPDEEQLQIASDVALKSHSSLSQLVLLGDKELFINDSSDAFIMYVSEGQSRITLGDPVGPEEEVKEMIWEFYETCVQKGWHPVFYLTDSHLLDYYVDLGLTLFKLGEQAQIPLQNFDPHEDTADEVVQNYSDFKDQDFQFRMLSGAALQQKMPELKMISDTCLEAQNRKDTGFSVGRFDEQFLQHFPVATIQKDGEIQAFSNLIGSGGHHELATDLFRYHPEMDHGIVDYLLINIMQWGKEEGYQQFNLGMAPLSGMETHDFSPGWSSLASLVYRYGENFYGFKKVRAYKNQFNPHWQPKYLVCPGGLALPRIISNLTNVVSGGFSKLVINSDEREF